MTSWNTELCVPRSCILKCTHTHIHAHTGPAIRKPTWWQISEARHPTKLPLTQKYALPWVSLVVQSVENLPAVQETWVWSLAWEDPWRRKWQPSPVSLPGKSHGQRSLVGCSPWGLKESGTTEWFTLTYALPLRDTFDLWIFYHNNGKHFLTLLLDISNHREKETENASVGLLVCRVHLRRYVSRRELQGLLATETVNYSFCFQWGEFSQNIKYMVFFEMVETMRKRPNLIQPNWKLRLWRPRWYACD